jgi:hypothetical protein
MVQSLTFLLNMENVTRIETKFDITERYRIKKTLFRSIDTLIGRKAHIEYLESQDAIKRILNILENL